MLLALSQQCLLSPYFTLSTSFPRPLLYPKPLSHPGRMVLLTDLCFYYCPIRKHLPPVAGVIFPKYKVYCVSAILKSALLHSYNEIWLQSVARQRYTAIPCHCLLLWHSYAHCAPAIHGRPQNACEWFQDAVVCSPFFFLIKRIKKR